MSRAPSKTTARIAELEAALAPVAALAAKLPAAVGDDTIVAFAGPSIRLHLTAGAIRAAARAVAGEG
jgi:hypothetical protein